MYVYHKPHGKLYFPPADGLANRPSLTSLTTGTATGPGDSLLWEGFNLTISGCGSYLGIRLPSTPFCPTSQPPGDRALALAHLPLMI